MSTWMFFIAIVLLILLIIAFKRSGRLNSKGTAVNDNKGTEKKPNDVIQFCVDQPNPEEIKQCKKDDAVKFWMPERDPDRIIIYRSGTFLGDGKIGYVPKEHFDKIGYAIRNNLDYTTKIIEKSETLCKIEYQKTPIEELIQREEKRQSYLENELRKKYSPRKPIEVLMNVGGSIRVPTGEKLNIIFKDLDFYLEQEEPTIEFQNSANKVIGSLAGTGEVIRILKAHFNGYQFHIEVLNAPIDRKEHISILIKPYKAQK